MRPDIFRSKNWNLDTQGCHYFEATACTSLGRHNYLILFVIEPALNHHCITITVSSLHHHRHHRRHHHHHHHHHRLHRHDPHHHYHHCDYRHWLVGLVRLAMHHSMEQFRHTDGGRMPPFECTCHGKRS